MVVTVVMPMKPKGGDDPQPSDRMRVVLIVVCLVGVIAGLVVAVESIAPRDRNPATQRAGASQPAASGPASATAK